MDLRPPGGPGFWQDIRRFGTDLKARSKEQCGALIQELRRYDGALVVIESSGRGALGPCDAVLK